MAEDVLAPESPTDEGAALFIQNLVNTGAIAASDEGQKLIRDSQRMRDLLDQLKIELEAKRKIFAAEQELPTPKLPALLTPEEMRADLETNAPLVAAEQAKRIAEHLLFVFSKNLPHADVLAPLAKAAIYLSAHFSRMDNLQQGKPADSRARTYQLGSGQPPNPPVAPPHGTDDNGGMEKRIETLEKDMREVRDRLVRVESTLQGVDKKVDAQDKKIGELPSKDFVTSSVSSSANKIILWVVGVVTAAQLIPPGLRALGLGG